MLVVTVIRDLGFDEDGNQRIEFREFDGILVYAVVPQELLEAYVPGKRLIMGDEISYAEKDRRPMIGNDDTYIRCELETLALVHPSYRRGSFKVDQPLPPRGVDSSVDRDFDE